MLDTDRFLVLPPSFGFDNNWHVSNENDTCVAHCYGFNRDIAGGEALARRIAACLNACRDLSTHLLEQPNHIDSGGVLIQGRSRGMTAPREATAEELRQEINMLKSVLSDCDEVLRTIEPDSTEESDELGGLIMAIAYALAPDTRPQGLFA